MTPTGRFLRCVLAVAFAVTGLRVGAQGTFAFNNTTLPGKPRILGWDYVTPISGTNWWIDVVVKDPATGLFRGGLLRQLADGNVLLDTIHPLTGANAGLFSGGTVVVPFLPPGASAEIMVRAWNAGNGPTYPGAGGHAKFVIPALGGVGSPPSLPASMANFYSFVAGTPLSPFMGIGLVSFRVRRIGQDVVLEWDEPDSMRLSTEMSWFVVDARNSPGQAHDPWYGWHIVETYAAWWNWFDGAKFPATPPPEMKPVFRDTLPIRDPANHVARLRLDPSAGDAWFFRVYWEHWHW